MWHGCHATTMTSHLGGVFTIQRTGRTGGVKPLGLPLQLSCGCIQRLCLIAAPLHAFQYGAGVMCFGVELVRTGVP